MVEELKEEGRRQARERYIQQQKRENEKWIKETEILEKNNEKKEKEIKEKKEIPSCYTCQKCQRDFITDKELNITLRQTPVCGICSGELL